MCSIWRIRSRHWKETRTRWMPWRYPRRLNQIAMWSRVWAAAMVTRYGAIIELVIRRKTRLVELGSWNERKSARFRDHRVTMLVNSIITSQNCSLYENGKCFPFRLVHWLFLLCNWYEALRVDTFSFVVYFTFFVRNHFERNLNLERQEI